MKDRSPPTNLRAATIDDVLVSLDRVIAWSIANGKRTGYFAALYKKVTVRVKEGIDARRFDDGARMERIDVLFANRYLDAFEAYHSGQPLTASWKLAFDTTKRWFPLVLQHLFLSMNAHINLDLGIAAAESVPRQDLAKLKPDFDKINELLGGLINEVEDELGKIWPPMTWVDKLAGRADEKLADRAMAFAREKAWAFATDYAAASDKNAAIDKLDRELLTLGNVFMSLGLFQWPVFFAIRMLEHGGVARKIEILR